MPYDVMLSNKSWVKKEEWGDIRSDGIYLPKYPLRVMGALLSWGWLHTCLPVGSTE